MLTYIYVFVCARERAKAMIA